VRRSVPILNTLHFPVEVGRFVFPPQKEVVIEVEKNSSEFRMIRSVKGLRIDKHDNAAWMYKHGLIETYDFNMVYDTHSQHRGAAYLKAIEALSNPIIKHLPEGASGFIDKPSPHGINLRFFSSMRIRQQGKAPVGPCDVFYSHGIGDKNYWIAERIAGYRFALVPGPAWKERIEAGGFRGWIYIVGYTKLDPLLNGEYVRQERPSGKPYIVWAPTHAYHSRPKGRSSYPDCMRLISEIPDCYEATVALHPTSRLGLTRTQDVTLQELLDADVVIADAGSTLYEAWALGKPVIFPDWICRDAILSHFSPGNLEYEIYNKRIGYHAKDMKHLVELIEVALHKGMRDPEIEFIERVFPSELRGQAGLKAAEALEEIKGAVFS